MRVNRVSAGRVHGHWEQVRGARQQAVRVLDADDLGQAQLLGQLAEARDAPAGLVADADVPHLPVHILTVVH